MNLLIFLSDSDRSSAACPDFAAGFYARSEAKRKMGDMKGGEKDFMLAMDLQKKTQYEPIVENTVASNNSKNPEQA